MTTGARDGRWMLIIGVAVTGFSMRTAVTSIGPVLVQLQQAFGMSSATSGALTMLPVLCFAVIGAATPWLMARAGMRMLLAASLATMTVGLATRVLVGQIVPFFALSLLALVGGAVANVVLPALIKEQFPDRIGAMTGLYTTTMAAGMTVGAGLTIPVGRILPGTEPWRTGLVFWALFSLIAVIPWLTQLRRDSRRTSGGLSLWAVGRSRLAWLVMLFFAMQSFQAYVAIGWFAKLLNSHGVPEAQAGAMVAALTAVSIPVYLVTAALPWRWHRIAIAVMCACYLVAYIGLLVAPVGGGWVWMILDGIGGGEFPLALVMLGLRTRDARVTGALSAFAQSIGYLLAALGPLLFGVLQQATGSWTAPIWMMVAATLLAACCGWLASVPRTVDDELAAHARATRPAAS